MSGFGLRDVLAALGSRRGLQGDALQVLNRNLADLGIDWVRVESFEKVASAALGESTYSVTLSIVGRGTDTYQINVR